MTRTLTRTNTGAAGKWSSTVSKVMADAACPGMVRKMPMLSETATSGRIGGPKVQTRYWGSVSTPLRRIGLAKSVASTKQPIPAPSVNHQAGRPYTNAACAVPTVDEPPTSAPTIIPETIGQPARRPATVKSPVERTRQPEISAVSAITRVTIATPMIIPVCTLFQGVGVVVAAADGSNGSGIGTFPLGEVG